MAFRPKCPRPFSTSRGRPSQCCTSALGNTHGRICPRSGTTTHHVTPWAARPHVTPREGRGEMGSRGLPLFPPPCGRCVAFDVGVEPARAFSPSARAVRGWDKAQPYPPALSPSARAMHHPETAGTPRADLPGQAISSKPHHAIDMLTAPDVTSPESRATPYPTAQGFFPVLKAPFWR